MPKSIANFGSAFSTDFATQARTTSFPTAGHAAARSKVLVVDDDVVNLMALQRLLGKWGYEVIPASWRAIPLTPDLSFVVLDRLLFVR